MQDPKCFVLCAAVLVLSVLATGVSASEVQLTTSYPVTSPSTIDYRWSDLDQNAYAQTYRDAYGYGDATVTVTFAETGEPTFVGHLSAQNLKPNFAYQVKLVGKPEALFDPLTEGGDDWTNERIGYAGRWWEVAPGTGNATDADYEAHKDDPAYIFEAYLLFDFFLTDATGGAELDFALDTSYHVLFWDWQGSPVGCNQPLKTTTVTGSAADPAYDADVGPVVVGVFPQIERLCVGGTVLPQGVYKCRILLTEESFHTSDGNWAPAMINDDVEFELGEGLFPPSLLAEPAFTAGLDNTVSWNGVSAATQYDVQCALDAAFTNIIADTGWIAGTTHAFGGLADGQTYHYRVKAGDGVDESSWSGAVSSTQDDTAPVSSAGPLPASNFGPTLSVPWTATDATSPISHVELHYRMGGEGYQRFGGAFTASPIPFAVPADGDYDFYTVAVDGAGNTETAPLAPDASCVLTVGAPEPGAYQDEVDIGDPASENGHALLGWGPVEPDQSGGGYGGAAAAGIRCRSTWANVNQCGNPTWEASHAAYVTAFCPDIGWSETGATGERWASLTLDFGTSGNAYLNIHNLWGTTLDDFDLYIDGDFIGFFAEGVHSGEVWVWTTIHVPGYTGIRTVTVAVPESTPEWSLRTTYGQVAFDRFYVCSNQPYLVATPAAADPIGCGGTRQVDFDFTAGCEEVGGYAVRVRCTSPLSFGPGDVAFNVLPSGAVYATNITEHTPGSDYTLEYTVTGGPGITADGDLFAIEFHGDADGPGDVIIESVDLTPVDDVGIPVVSATGATIVIDCAAPAGSFVINGGAAATNDLNVVLTNAVTDATPLQMRFVNAPDTWADAEDGWVDYAASLAWILAAGPDGPRTVNAEFRDALAQVLAASDAISLISNGPESVSDIAAAPGNRKIVVTWTDPDDPNLAGVEVWRGLWHDGVVGASAYPEYDDLLGNTIPTRPAGRAEAFASAAWELAGTALAGEETFTDTNGPGGLARGVYWYEVYARDTENLYGPAAAANARATSYLLGDMDGDGAVTLGTDINGGLSLCYGTAEGQPGYDPECDIGATDDWSGLGIPLTDNLVDFLDLMIFALNYDLELARQAPPAGGLIAEFVWRQLDETVWALELAAPCRSLKGLRLRAALPAGSVAAVVPGAMLGVQSSPCFLQNIDAHGLDAGLVLLGGDLVFTGEGELLRVVMQPNRRPGEVEVEARDACNALVHHTLATIATEGIPQPLTLAQNRPNPFNPSTSIAFTLPGRQPVRLAVYDVEGRLLSTLVQEELAAGQHVRIWKGLDDQGQAVASGVYFCRLLVGTEQVTRKMTLVR